MESMPLVSVPVITYNSSKYVLETLESIKAQTYRNIELIVSDDCSTDNTVEICREWIEKNKERFARTEILTTPVNTGISANLNRAESVCQGDWVKGIAGDDILCFDCIEKNIEFTECCQDCVFVFSRVEVFGNNLSLNNHFNKDIFDYSFFSLSQEEQYKWLIDKMFQPIPAATAFKNRKKALSLGILRYDERIPMLEDWPMWIKAMEKGILLYFNDMTLVKYRISDDSVCSGNKYKKSFVKSMQKLFISYQLRPSIRLFGVKRTVKHFLQIKALSGNRFWVKGERVINRLF